MNPKQVSDVISAVRKEVGLPVHFHAHCIGGMADICYWEAIKAGACTVDCDVSSLSLGPSHPPLESIVTCLKGKPDLILIWIWIFWPRSMIILK